MYNYNDYLKVKKGNEFFASYKKNDVVCLNRFINYETFLFLSKTYYERLNLNRVSVLPPTSIYEANDSFICYETLLNHVDSCKFCSCVKSTDEVLCCREVQQILYPYGESIIKNDKLRSFAFPYKMNVDNFCKVCPSEKVEINSLEKMQDLEQIQETPVLLLSDYQIDNRQVKSSYKDPEIFYAV
jgi:hypothetical protein